MGSHKHLPVLVYSSIKEYEAAVNPISTTPSRDPCLPKTPAEEKAWVSVIYQAMRDMQYAQDNVKVRNDWEKKLEQDAQKIERAAWAVLENMVKYFTRPEGVGLNPYGSYVNAKWIKTEGFVEMVAGVCGVLRVSLALIPFFASYSMSIIGSDENMLTKTQKQHQKTLCKQLLMDSALDKLIDNTAGAEKRVQNNRLVNQRKKDTLENAKKGVTHPTQVSFNPMAHSFGFAPRQASLKRQFQEVEDESSSEDEETESERNAKRAALRAAVSTSSILGHSSSSPGREVYGVLTPGATNWLVLAHTHFGRE